MNLETSIIRWNVVHSKASDEDGSDLTDSEKLLSIAKGKSHASVYHISQSNFSKGNYLKMRFLGASEDSDNTYQIYLGTKDGQEAVLTKLLQVVATTGAQVSNISGYNYCDNLVITEKGNTQTINSVNDTDGISAIDFDLQGDDVIVIVSTSNNNDGKVEAKFY